MLPAFPTVAAPYGAQTGRRSPISIPRSSSKRYGEPLVGIHRGALHLALIEGLGHDRLALGAEIQRLSR